MTTAQLCCAFGLTLRHLQWLDEADVVRPTVKRHRRQGGRYYDTQRAVLIGIVSALQEKHLSLHAIRKLLPSIEARLSRLPKFLAATKHGLLLTDSRKDVLAFGCEMRTGVYVVDLAAIQQRVEALEQREKTA